MSLDLYERETEDKLARMMPVQRPEPGAWDGFLRGTGLATMRTLAKAGRAVDLVGSIGPIVQDRFTGGTEAQDRYFREHDDVFGSAVEHWTPKPGEVGMAGEVVGTILGTLPLVLASPALAVGATQLGVGEDLVAKGVDPVKAGAVGAVQGAGLGLGIYMPIFGQSLFQRMLIGGAGFNVIQGAAMRGVSEVILSGTPGADDYKALDPTSLTLDLLLGAAFGAITHLSPAQRAQGAEAWKRIGEWGKTLGPGDVEALATLRQAQHANVDSLPGRPVGPEDLTAHVGRLQAATEQLLRGERVQVEDMPAARVEAIPERVAEAEARGRSLVDEAERLRVEEGLPEPLPTPEPIPRNSPPEGAAEARAVATDLNDAAVKSIVQGMRSEIGFDDRGGRVLVDMPGADTAPGMGDVIGRTPWTGQRWWFERPDAGLSADRARAAIDKWVDGKKLGAREQRFIDYMQELVHIRYGETAAAPVIRGDLPDFEVRLAAMHPKVDAVFQEHPTGVIEIVDFGLIDPVADRGGQHGFAAMREITGFADRNGRELMLMAQPNRGSDMPLAKLVELYERHDFVRSAQQPYDDSVMMERLPREITDQSQGTQRSPAQARPAEPAGEARGTAQDQNAPEVTPLSAAADRVVAESPDLIITIGRDADGEPITVSAKQFLEEARAEVARAREDAELFEVAASCMFGAA